MSWKRTFLIDLELAWTIKLLYAVKLVKALILQGI